MNYYDTKYYKDFTYNNFPFFKYKKFIKRVKGV